MFDIYIKDGDSLSIGNVMEHILKLFQIVFGGFVDIVHDLSGEIEVNFLNVSFFVGFRSRCIDC